MTEPLSRLIADRRGAAAIEFALLALAFLLMFIGVLQVGLSMQAHNSLRQVSAQTAREVSVQYQTNNRLTNSQIAQVATANATSAPYILQAGRLNVTVQLATTQRVPNARDLTLRFRYRVPTFLDFAGIDGPELDYTRPIFVES